MQSVDSDRPESTGLRRYARACFVRLVVGGGLAFGLPIVGGALMAAPLDLQRVALLALVGLVAFVPVAWWSMGPMRRAEGALAGYLSDLSDGDALACRDFPVAIEGLVEHFAQRAALLDELASVDSLTGLPNRAAALDRLRSSVELAKRDEVAVTVALVDIDALDTINEAFGFGMGDRVVSTVGQRLEGLVRGSDWTARWGSDTFLAVLFADPDGSMVALDRIVNDLAVTHLVRGDERIEFTVSIGATHVREGDRPKSCIGRAHEQLAAARSAGPGRFSLET